MSDSGLPWYKEGLKFKCTECGKCCTGSSGYVWLTLDEMQEMANVLQLPLDLFKRKYIRQKGHRFALIEKRALNGDYDCIFLEDKKCKIYQARPLQCRTFPWWPENLRSEESWKSARLECEGINDEAPTVSYEHIQEQLEKQSQA
ncbi:MAG: YkgJ family cysteine cluster protein [Parachlamydiaceae bacterium]